MERLPDKPKARNPMSSITIHLRAETERSLTAKAKQGGQTLEAYLERLAEHEAGNGNTDSTAAPPEEDEEPAERPWRGVFVPPRPRNVLFTLPVVLRADQLPRRQPAHNLSWHRAVDDDA